MSADGPHRDWAQFPTFRIWKCCKCHIIEPGHTCNLPSESSLRLQNATQTNPSLTIGWQKNCSSEHPGDLSKRKIWPCCSELRALGIQELNLTPFEGG